MSKKIKKMSGGVGTLAEIGARTVASRTRDEARKRGHEGRTVGGSVGALLGAAVGSFFGLGGTIGGAAVGAGLGGVIGSSIDGGAR